MSQVAIPAGRYGEKVKRGSLAALRERHYGMYSVILNRHYDMFTFDRPPQSRFLKAGIGIGWWLSITQDRWLWAVARW